MKTFILDIRLPDGTMSSIQMDADTPIQATAWAKRSMGGKAAFILINIRSK